MEIPTEQAHKIKNGAFTSLDVQNILEGGVDYTDVINHASQDGHKMKEALEKVITPSNVHILSRAEFEQKLQACQISYSCIDGRSIKEDNDTVTVHVAGDAFGLYVLATMQALSDLGVSADIDDDIVEQFLTANNIQPTSHSGDHMHGDDSVQTCDCGHCTTNSIDLDNKLLDIANKHYTDPAPVRLVGDHKEQAIIVSPSTDILVLVDTPNELSNGDTSNQAQEQVFWNDAGAIQVCIEHYTPSLAQIASQVSGKSISKQQMSDARNKAYNTQLDKTVQTLKSSKPLADAGKIFDLQYSDGKLKCVNHG